MDSAERFAALINRPSAGVHLDVLAALVGAAFDPAADVEVVCTELDQLAGRYEPTFEAIMAGLFGSGLLRGNSDDYGDPRNSFLHEVLTRRVGLPITLSVIAIEVGRRADVPIVGVGLPGHFIVRDTSSGRFGDPFHGGRLYEHDEVGPAWQRITRSREPLRPGMLLPTPTRSIVLRMLNNLRNTMLQRDDQHGLGVLADLRGAFPELAGERSEHAHWKRIWN